MIALRDHLRMVEDEAGAKLTQQMSLGAYKALNETVLAQVIIFNKRREGEASRLTLGTYKKASTNAINEETLRGKNLITLRPSVGGMYACTMYVYC